MSSQPLPDGVATSTTGSGLRVITEEIPSVRSVAVGLWIRTGSRDEDPAEAGVSHFLEHLLFKGTKRHSAIEIAEIFDGIGAAVNAATSKESTHLYARFLDEHTERAFDVLSEMLLGPTYPEIDSERDVVLEEIAMYEDEPQDRVHDVLADALFGDHPLGRRVLGKADVIASIPVPDISRYHSERYVASNIVVAAAGNLKHESILSLAEAQLAPAIAGPDPDLEHGGDESGRFRFYAKETEQYHVCFGAPGLPRGDERRYTLGILDAVLGGSASSRLFREIREKRGLAYAVGTYSEQYIERGLVAIYVGTREENLEELGEIVGRELGRITSEGITRDELERAKENIKGRTVLGLESTSARMSRLARATLFDVELLSIDELLARIDSVTLGEVAELAAELWEPERISAACIGANEERFRSTLGPVSERLVAA
ncbi:MAG: M16 family metallopeptidase [Solirubrobacterales bacterium]